MKEKCNPKKVQKNQCDTQKNIAFERKVEKEMMEERRNEGKNVWNEEIVNKQQQQQQHEQQKTNGQGRILCRHTHNYVGVIDCALTHMIWYNGVSRRSYKIQRKFVYDFTLESDQTLSLIAKENQK